ncbi:androgen-dependent TFPI-regulating protein [Aphomia sociella]
MSYHIYFRILGYVVTMGLHIGNIIVMAQHRPKHVVEDPRIRVYAELQSRYFTCWTFFLQIVFAVSGLICDTLILKNSRTKDYKLPKYLKGFRDTLFSGIVWPTSWLVCTFFWSLYMYDRSLIYPDFVDQLLSSTSNHIMHTAIVPIVVWEVLFQPRSTPRSHVRNLLHLTFHLALYFSVLVYTYVERGLWIYPVFKTVYGTVYFYLVVAFIVVLCLIYYYMQWFITTMIWGSLRNEKLKSKVR